MVRYPLTDIDILYNPDQSSELRHINEKHPCHRAHLTRGDHRGNVKPSIRMEFNISAAQAQILSSALTHIQHKITQERDDHFTLHLEGAGNIIPALKAIFKRRQDGSIGSELENSQASSAQPMVDSDMQRAIAHEFSDFIRLGA
ncbi:MAG: hypothetical protein ACK4VI_05025 [Alphaproteobacteria bacterium]